MFVTEVSPSGTVYTPSATVATTGRVGSWATVKLPSLAQYETCPARLTRANLKCPCPEKAWPDTVIRPE